MRRALVALALATIGCASEPRFADRDIVWHDRDDAPIPLPAAPPNPGTGRLAVGARNAIFRPLDRLLSADYAREAANVNALDEVPDSSWYVDPRRDPRDPAGPPRALTAAEMERGNLDEPPPQPPLTIRRTLSGGSTPGFVVDDATHRRWAIKLDPIDHPALLTGADIVATRLAWASGWRVPGNAIVELDRGQLVLAPDATSSDDFGRRHPLSAGDVDRILGRVARAPDGRIRAEASRWIEGHVLGAFSWQGRNAHDPNDRCAHENRRDLRGFGVWAAWVDDVDVIENNTLDSYVGEPGRGHVVHYELDVGGSFGVFSGGQAQYWMGDESYFQFGRILGSLLTLGLLPRAWDDPAWHRRQRALDEQYPELGAYSTTHFDPRRWSPIVDVPPFVRQTDRDRYWGAKRLAAFDEAELRAAIAAGRYRPAAAQYLFTTLWGRRRRILHDDLSATSALDYVRFDGARVCFTDLWVKSGLGGASGTTYRAREHGRVVDVKSGGDAGGRACLTLPSADGYRIVELATLRPGERHFGPALQVHFMERGGKRRVLGLLR